MAWHFSLLAHLRKGPQLPGATIGAVGGDSGSESEAGLGFSYQVCPWFGVGIRQVSGWYTVGVR